MILDKEIDEVLNFDSKDLSSQSATISGKTSRQVWKTESNSNESEPSRDFTSSDDIFDYLDEGSIDSLEYEQDNHESYDSDIYHHFSNQLLEEETEEDNIQSSKILGSLCD